MTCRKSKKDLAVYDWTLGDLTRLSAKYFWTWAKTNTMGYDGNDYLARDNCVPDIHNLEKYLPPSSIKVES